MLYLCPCKLILNASLPKGYNLEQCFYLLQPTLHFFQNGKKADVLIGADVARLTNITEKLFK